jgi:hypothetical protein
MARPCVNELTPKICYVMRRLLDNKPSYEGGNIFVPSSPDMAEWQRSLHKPNPYQSGSLLEKSRDDLHP